MVQMKKTAKYQIKNALTIDLTAIIRTATTTTTLITIAIPTI